MKAKIGIITLGVTDLERSKRFYVDGLGFPFMKDNEDYSEIVFMQLENIVLALYPIDKLADDITIPTPAITPGSITLAHNTVDEASVDAVFKEAIDAGATAIKQPEKVFWGGYSGYFADPDGHLWEVAYNPFTDLS